MAKVKAGTDDVNEWVFYPNDFMLGKTVEVPDDLLADFNAAVARYVEMQRRMDEHMRSIGYYDKPFDSQL